MFVDAGVWAQVMRRGTQNTVDLHGLSVRQAYTAILSFLHDLRCEARGMGRAGRMCTGGAFRAVSLITGRGHHSRGGISVLRAATERLLRSLDPPIHDYFYRARNTGVIVIDIAPLVAWIKTPSVPSAQVRAARCVIFPRESELTPSSRLRPSTFAGTSRCHPCPTSSYPLTSG